VSFARSGNSPESTAAVQLVRDLVPNARFLNITCNADGELAQQGANDSHFNLMPAASCDRGFAMTSSFTCMLLAALSVLDPDFQPARLNKLAGWASRRPRNGLRRWRNWRAAACRA
jgi:tagatose-6-phosphate ketose/aldose isomerase